MKKKQETALYISDNIEYMRENEGMTVAEYILMNDEGMGIFDNWDEEEEGMTASEYKQWVNDTYGDLSCQDEDLDERLSIIKYNETGLH